MNDSLLASGRVVNSCERKIKNQVIGCTPLLFWGQTIVDLPARCQSLVYLEL